MQAKDSVKFNDGFKWALGIGVALMLFFSIAAYMNLSAVRGDLESDFDAEMQRALQELTEQKDGIITEKDNLILEKDNQILELQTVEEEEQVSLIGYIIDEIFFNVPVSEDISDREVMTLFDGEVDVDGDDYDAEEVFSLVDWNMLANEKDFMGDDYMTVPRDGVEYKIVFDTNLNTSTIDDKDRSLEFSFLGKEVEVVKWNVDEVTFFKGTEYTMTLDETLIIEDREVVLSFISEEHAYIVVDGVGNKIREGETGRFDGLEIKVDTVLFTDFNPAQNNRVQMIIGTDVENSVSDGEEYAEDSVWEWKIDANSMGIILKEEYMELDDEYKPLAKGESLCLPNDYVCVEYEGLVEEDMEEYSFELDTRNELNYVEVRGNFISGLADYDRVFINLTGIYDEDLVLIGSEVELDDSDVSLVLNGSVLKVGDIELPLNLTTVKVNGKDISTTEDSFRNEYGTLVVDPEANIEDFEARLEVPEEQLEASLRVY